MEMKEFLETTIQLRKLLSSKNPDPSIDVNSFFKDFFTRARDILNSTEKVFRHPKYPTGTVAMHDGFLRVVSEKKGNGKYHTFLKGEGFLYADPDKDRAKTENTELGCVDVEIRLTLKEPLRGLNNRILYSFQVHDGVVGAVFHDEGKLRSLESPYEAIEVTLGNRIKHQPVQKFPAILRISTENGPVELPALWGSNQKVEVWDETISQAINFEEYDFSNRFPGVNMDKVDIFLKDDPSIQSKVALKTETSFQTSSRIHDYHPSEEKASSPKL